MSRWLLAGLVRSAIPLLCILALPNSCNGQRANGNNVSMDDFLRSIYNMMRPSTPSPDAGAQPPMAPADMPNNTNNNSNGTSSNNDNNVIPDIDVVAEFTTTAKPNAKEEGEAGVNLLPTEAPEDNEVPGNEFGEGDDNSPKSKGDNETTLHPEVQMPDSHPHGPEPTPLYTPVSDEGNRQFPPGPSSTAVASGVSIASHPTLSARQDEQGATIPSVLFDAGTTDLQDSATDENPQNDSTTVVSRTNMTSFTTTPGSLRENERSLASSPFESTTPADASDANGTNDPLSTIVSSVSNASDREEGIIGQTPPVDAAALPAGGSAPRPNSSKSPGVDEPRDREVVKITGDLTTAIYNGQEAANPEVTSGHGEESIAPTEGEQSLFPEVNMPDNNVQGPKPTPLFSPVITVNPPGLVTSPPPRILALTPAASLPADGTITAVPSVIFDAVTSDLENAVIEEEPSQPNITRVAGQVSDEQGNYTSTNTTKASYDTSTSPNSPDLSVEINDDNTSLFPEVHMPTGSDTQGSEPTAMYSPTRRVDPPFASTVLTPGISVPTPAAPPARDSPRASDPVVLFDVTTVDLTDAALDNEPLQPNITLPATINDRGQGNSSTTVDNGATDESLATQQTSMESDQEGQQLYPEVHMPQDAPAGPEPTPLYRPTVSDKSFRRPTVPLIFAPTPAMPDANGGSRSTFPPALFEANSIDLPDSDLDKEPLSPDMTLHADQATSTQPSLADENELLVPTTNGVKNNQATLAAGQAIPETGSPLEIAQDSAPVGNTEGRASEPTNRPITSATSYVSAEVTRGESSSHQAPDATSNGYTRPEASPTSSIGPNVPQAESEGTSGRADGLPPSLDDNVNTHRSSPEYRPAVVAPTNAPERDLALPPVVPFTTESSNNDIRPRPTVPPRSSPDHTDSESFEPTIYPGRYPRPDGDNGIGVALGDATISPSTLTPSSVGPSMPDQRPSQDERRENETPENSLNRLEDSNDDRRSETRREQQSSQGSSQGTPDDKVLQGGSTWRGRHYPDLSRNSSPVQRAVTVGEHQTRLLMLVTMSAAVKYLSSGTCLLL